MLKRNGHTQFFQLIDQRHVAFKLRHGDFSVGLVCTGEVGEDTGDLEIFQLADGKNRCNCPVIGRETDAAHTGIDLQMDGLHAIVFAGQSIELFGSFLTENSRGQLVDDHLLQTIVAGITQNQNGICAAGFPEHDTLFPDGHRKAVNTSIVQGGIDIPDAVAVAVTF